MVSEASVVETPVVEALRATGNMWLAIIIIAILAFYALPSLLEHRERMAQLKKDNQDKQ